MEEKTKSKIPVTFDRWTVDDLDEFLDISRSPQPLPELTSWLQSEGELPSDWRKDVLELLGQRMAVMTTGWNEAELQLQFIGPLFQTLMVHNYGCNFFNQRPLKVTIRDTLVRGIVDGLLAHGISHPKKPYLFVHEYKRVRGIETQPIGQLLIAMYAALEQNEDHQPDRIMHGCYIIDSNWRFVVLKNRQFSESKSYDASDLNELTQIWHILQRALIYFSGESAHQTNK